MDRVENLNPDMAYSITQYLLTSNITPDMQEKVKRFSIAFCNLMALGNIEREDILTFKTQFREINQMLRANLYDPAEELMADMLMTIQLSRSVGGFYTVWSSGGMQKSEHIEKMLARQRKKTFGSRVKEAFRRKKEPEYAEAEAL